MRYDAAMQPRRRAPRRAGHRTTLTIPDPILQTADRLARELGTTTNDAIVRLAQEGASARERQAQISALTAARRAAVEHTGLSDALTFPSALELREAMLAGRRDP
jgi:predicted DNA-binding ribbon-helix-helix protein